MVSALEAGSSCRGPGERPVTRLDTKTSLVGKLAALTL
jgi:hypothetical protein